MEILEGFGMFWKVLEEFLEFGENQERVKGNLVGLDTDSWGRRTPPPLPNPPAKEGSPTRTPPPMAPPSFK